MFWPFILLKPHLRILLVTVSIEWLSWFCFIDISFRNLFIHYQLHFKPLENRDRDYALVNLSLSWMQSDTTFESIYWWCTCLTLKVVSKVFTLSRLRVKKLLNTQCTYTYIHAQLYTVTKSLIHYFKASKSFKNPYNIKFTPVKWTIQCFLKLYPQSCIIITTI